MASPSTTLITLGLLLLGGLVTDYIGRHTFLPRVSALILFGFLAGPPVLDVLPGMSSTWFPYITDIVLVMVGFLLGSSLTVSAIEECGICVLAISLSVVLVTTAMVASGLYALGAPPAVCLICGAIATSTAPAAVMDVVRESGGARTKAARILLRITAIDDAWGLIMFSLMLLAAQATVGEADFGFFVRSGLWEIGGALLVGVVLGIPMSYFTDRIAPGEPTMAKAVGMVLLCGGIAVWLEVSHLLASMTMGVIVANFAKHQARPFHAIESLEWPFIVIFFIFSGASLHLDILAENHWLLLAYIILRIASRLLGGKIGGRIAGADPKMENWMGVAMMPQAGVALGMALIAAQRFPALESIVTVIVAATIFFEIIGPVCTRFALKKMEKNEET